MLKNEFNLKISDIKYFAGHSLGEYTALVASESLKFSDALHLVHNRGKLMQSAVPLGKGAMLAVMGLNIVELNSMLKKMNSIRVSVKLQMIILQVKLFLVVKKKL